MRLKIQLSSRRDIFLHRHHLHQLQAMIYNLLEDPDLNRSLHEDGMAWENRIFKPFTFSWLRGKISFSKENETIRFQSPIFLILSSCSARFLHAANDTLVRSESIQLGANSLHVDSVEVLPEPDFAALHQLFVLSPITVYSTLDTAEGKKFTRYYEPQDPAFATLVHENLLKKAEALYQVSLREEDFSFRPIGHFHPKQRKSVLYKGFLIRAWEGLFEMQGHPLFRKIAYDVGIGAKSAQGFGCIDFLPAGASHEEPPSAPSNP